MTLINPYGPNHQIKALDYQDKALTIEYTDRMLTFTDADRLAFECLKSVSDPETLIKVMKRHYNYKELA